jgi:hypothetical protein
MQYNTAWFNHMVIAWDQMPLSIRIIFLLCKQGITTLLDSLSANISSIGSAYSRTVSDKIKLFILNLKFAMCEFERRIHDILCRVCEVADCRSFQCQDCDTLRCDALFLVDWYRRFRRIYFFQFQNIYQNIRGHILEYLILTFTALII